MVEDNNVGNNMGDNVGNNISDNVGDEYGGVIDVDDSGFDGGQQWTRMLATTMAGGSFNVGGDG